MIGLPSSLTAASQPSQDQSMPDQITIEQLHGLFKAQEVSARDHIAYKCVICGTVQSMASLIRAGCKPDQAERSIGFSCEGRFSNAGPWPSDKKNDAKSVARRKIRGCDWTLGGLFRLHKLEVVDEYGKTHPIFDVATPEEAKALEQLMFEKTVS